MALGTFIAGAYSATYNPGGGAADIGIMEQGYQIGITYAKELIAQTDKFASTVIDAVFQGVSAVMVNCISLEYKNAVLAAMFPYQGTAMTATGASYFDLGTIGVLDTNEAGTLILTATANTPAASSPITLTASETIIRENHELQWALTSALRKIPLSFRLYPYLDTQYKFFTTT